MKIVNDIKLLGLNAHLVDFDLDSELLVRITKDGSDVELMYRPLDYRVYYSSKIDGFKGSSFDCVDEEHLLEVLHSNIHIFDEDVKNSNYFFKIENLEDPYA